MRDTSLDPHTFDDDDDDDDGGRRWRDGSDAPFPGEVEDMRTPHILSEACAAHAGRSLFLVRCRPERRPAATTTRRLSVMVVALVCSVGGLAPLPCATAFQAGVAPVATAKRPTTVVVSAARAAVAEPAATTTRPVNDPRAKAELQSAIRAAAEAERNFAEQLIRLAPAQDDDDDARERTAATTATTATTPRRRKTPSSPTPPKAQSESAAKADDMISPQQQGAPPRRRGRGKKKDEAEQKSAVATKRVSARSAQSARQTRKSAQTTTQQKPEKKCANPMDALFDARLLHVSEERQLGEISQRLHRAEAVRERLLDDWEAKHLDQQQQQQQLERGAATSSPGSSSSSERKDGVVSPIPAGSSTLGEEQQQPQHPTTTERDGKTSTVASKDGRQTEATGVTDTAAAQEETAAVPPKRKRRPHADAELEKRRADVGASRLFEPHWARALNTTVQDLRNIIDAGRAARQALVAANMRLVFVMAKKHEGRGVGFSDLVQEGSIGLMCAAVKYDPGRGYKFGTYAFHWIRQSMLRSVACQSRLIRLPMYVHDEVVRLHRQKTAFLWDHAREPTEQELAEKLDVTPAKVRRLIDAAVRTTPISVDDTLAPSAANGNRFVAQAAGSSHYASGHLNHGAGGSSSSQYGSGPLGGYAGGGLFSGGPTAGLSSASSFVSQRGSSPLNHFDDASGAIYFSGGRRVHRPQAGFLNRNSGYKKFDEKALRVADTLVSSEPAGETAVDLELMHKTLMKILKEFLTPDEQWVIRHRFGLEDGHRKTQAQIAAIGGVDKKWVKGQEASGLRKLRHPHPRILLDGFNRYKEDILSDCGRGGLFASANQGVLIPHGNAKGMHPKPSRSSSTTSSSSRKSASEGASVRAPRRAASSSSSERQQPRASTRAASAAPPRRSPPAPRRVNGSNNRQNNPLAAPPRQTTPTRSDGDPRPDTTSSSRAH